MGFYGCPIEPSDWSDGPDDPDYEPCPDCDEGKVSREAMVVDSISYPAIVDKECESCGGTGFLPLSDYEPDWGYDD